VSNLGAGTIGSGTIGDPDTGTVDPPGSGDAHVRWFIRVFTMGEKVGLPPVVYEPKPSLIVDGSIVMPNGLDLSNELSLGTNKIKTADPSMIRWLDASPHMRRAS
jgi:hypothetical protein